MYVCLGVTSKQSECACVFAQHRRIMYVGRFSQASALWDFDNPCWITFISHILWHLTLNETLHSLLLHSSALIPLFPSLCLPPYIAALLRKQGVGRQSQSLSRFKVPFLPLLPSLLLCSTCCCLIKLFHSFPHSLSPSLPPTVGVCLVTEHLSGFCLLISSHQLCVLTCFRIWTTPCSLWRCSVLFTFNNTCTSGCHILHVL